MGVVKKSGKNKTEKVKSGKNKSGKLKKQEKDKSGERKIRKKFARGLLIVEHTNNKKE